jgi:hypothetical protein
MGSRGSWMSNDLSLSLAFGRAHDREGMGI